MSAQQIPDNMLAAQLLQYNQPYKIHHIPTPKIKGEYEMLVKITAASLCHTDGMVSSGVFNTKLPVIPSHEGAGKVVVVGSKVNRFKPGDRVLVGIEKNRCGTCAECTGDARNHQYCRKFEGHCGVQIDGAFAEYEVCDSREAERMPDSISAVTAAPLACAGRTVFRGIWKASLKPGEWLALVGSGGGLGHLGIQIAKAKGLKVIGIDARDEGLAVSKEFGADVVIDARKGKEQVVKEVQEATGGRGADCTLCLSDHPSAASIACGVTKMHGNMIQIAQPDEVVIPFQEIVFRDIRVIGSLLGSHQEIAEMFDLVAEHNIRVKANLFYGLDKLPDLMELAHSGKMSGKPIIVVDQEAADEEKRAGIFPV